MPRDSGAQADAARIREKLGDVLAATGRFDEALDELDAAAAAYEAAGDLEALGRVTARIGFVHTFRGTPAAGGDRIRSLLRRLESQAPSQALAALYVQLALPISMGFEPDEQLHAAARARALAPVVQDPRLLAGIQDQYGLALALTGRVEEAMQVFEQGLRIAETVGDSTELADLLGHLGLGIIAAGEMARGKEHALRALGVARRIGDPVRAGQWGALVGLGCILAGDWSEARRAIDDSVAQIQAVGLSALAAYPLFGRGWLQVAKGSWRQAGQNLRESLLLAEESANLQGRRWATAILADMRLLEGRPAVAASAIDPLLDRAGFEEWDVTLLLPYRAWAYLELGETAAAAQLIAAAVERSRVQQFAIVEVEALRVQGMVMGREGRQREAETSFAEAVERCRAMPYPYAEGRALYEWGRMLAGADDLPGAREKLSHALSLFEHLGARWYRAATTEAIDTLGQPQ